MVRTWPKKIYNNERIKHQSIKKSIKTLTIEHDQKYIYNILFRSSGFYLFGGPVLVHASNFPKNQKLDLNSGNFLLVGSSPEDFVPKQ